MQTIVYKWGQDNNQEFNRDKFESISFSIDGSSQLYYDPWGKPIPSKNDVKDLGVIFSSDISFRTHIQTLAAKGKKLTGWVLRVFDSKDELTMLTLLKSVIISSMEYCSIIWSPTDAENINTLEKIQRNFTKKIYGLSGLHYWDRLAKLKLYSLQRRRERYAIFYIWKIILEIVPNPGIKYNTVDREGGILLDVPQTRNLPTKLRENSFFCHGPKLFNSLPSHLRKLTTYEGEGDEKVDEVGINEIKKVLDKFFLTIPDEPIFSQYRNAKTNSLVDQIKYAKL